MLLIAGCHRGGGTAVDDAAAPLPDQPLAITVPVPEARDPLNLYDVLIPGTPTPHAVGAIGDDAILVRTLDEVTAGVFTRIGSRLHEARAAGVAWLVADWSLRRLAAADGADLAGFLRARFARLPEPPADELTALAATPGVTRLPAGERAAATRSLWRLRRWAIVRSMLVRDGRQGLQVDWRGPVGARGIDSAAAEGSIDGHPLTRAQVRDLAGFAGDDATREYYRVATAQVAKYAESALRAREADRLGITVAELEARAESALPRVGDAEVRRYLAARPQLGDDVAGARQMLSLERQVRALADRDARLRVAAPVLVHVREPESVRRRIEPPAPLRHGSGPVPLVAFVGVGCRECGNAGRAVLLLLQTYPDRVTVLVADSFPVDDLVGYRGALGLHCAAAAGRFLPMLGELTERERFAGTVTELAEAAAAAGLDGAELAACVDQDRHLPDIVENLHLARRLGLLRGEPAMLVNGVRLTGLRRPLQLVGEARAALELPPP